MRLGYEHLRSGDRVEVVIDRISNTGNGVVSQKGEMIVKDGDFSPGDTVSVVVTDKDRYITAKPLEGDVEESLPTVRIVERNGKRKLVIQTNSEEWDRFLTKRKERERKKQREIEEHRERRREEQRKEDEEWEEHKRKMREKKRQEGKIKSPKEIAEALDTQETTQGQKEDNQRTAARDENKNNYNKLLNGKK